MLTKDELETEAKILSKQIADILLEEDIILDVKTVFRINKLILEAFQEVTSSSVLDDDS